MADVRVCAVGDVKPGAAKRVDIEGHRLCVVRLGDDWYVIGDECSHEDYSLSEGDVWEDDCEIECPKHGSTFDLNTGRPRTLPATQPVEVFPVKVENDDVMIEVAEE
jgi:3-phenylpropionate/trans-cinnamate dioxygenase ferredoxin subunit